MKIRLVKFSLLDLSAGKAKRVYRARQLEHNNSLPKQRYWYVNMALVKDFASDPSPFLSAT